MSRHKDSGRTDATQEPVATQPTRPVALARMATAIQVALSGLYRADADQTWEQMDDSGRDHVLTFVAQAMDLVSKGRGPDALHDLWCIGKRSAGWSYGTQKSDNAKKHPFLMPFADAPMECKVRAYALHGLLTGYGVNS